VAFGHDDVMDPWFPMGTANPLQVCARRCAGHPDDLAGSDRRVLCHGHTRAAEVLSLGDSYGIAAGRPASLIVLPATDPFDAVRRQVRPWYVIAHGRVVAETPPVAATLTCREKRREDRLRASARPHEATWPR